MRVGINLTLDGEKDSNAIKVISGGCIVKTLEPTDKVINTRAIIEDS